MLRCTFYRGFCAWFSAGLLINDAWPFVANMAENTYTHNDAPIWAADVISWDPPVRNTPTGLRENSSSQVSDVRRVDHRSGLGPPPSQ